MKWKYIENCTVEGLDGCKIPDIYMADAPPSSLFQRERESLSGLLEIVRQNRIAVSKEEGDAREGREGVKLMGGINEGSVEEVRGSDKLSTARQPKSLSQSITFSPPLLSVCLIDFFFFILAGVLKAWLKWLLRDFLDWCVRKIWWFVSLGEE